MLALIGAMEEEVAGVRAALSGTNTHEYAGLSFTEGGYCGHRCVVVRAGVGKVNAALCTQVLIDHFPVSAVVNTGIAGAVSPAVGIGDLVLCTDALEYDMDATDFGYAPGQIPRMDTLAFPADAALRALAKEAAATVLPDIKVHEGRVLSADRFLSSLSEKEALYREFQGACCEMEGAGIAHVCYLNQMPYLVMRAISDNADDTAEIDYNTFEKLAIERSIRLSLELLKRYEGKQNVSAVPDL